MGGGVPDEIMKRMLQRVIDKDISNSLKKKAEVYSANVHSSSAQICQSNHKHSTKWD